MLPVIERRGRCGELCQVGGGNAMEASYDTGLIDDLYCTVLNFYVGNHIYR